MRDGEWVIAILAILFMIVMLVALVQYYKTHPAPGRDLKYKDQGMTELVEDNRAGGSEVDFDVLP